MAVFVLAHGSMRGGWVWWKVAPLLREAGHHVTTPTYTGMGERSHLLTPEIGLYDHTKDMLQHLYYENLTDIILVGHSYGGAVISEVAEQATDRIRRLVYLDAFVPADGQSLYDLMPPESVTRWHQRRDELGEGWYIPPFGPETMNITDPADLEYVLPRLTNEPDKTHTTPVRMPANKAATLPRSYIWTDDREPFRGFAQRARAEGWDTYELIVGHFPMVVASAETAEILNKIAAQS